MTGGTGPAHAGMTMASDPAGGGGRPERRGLRRYLTCLAVASFLTGGFFVASFFVNLRTMQVDYAGYGTVWPLQMFYNFMHGRPFQSSIYASDELAKSVGFLRSPHAYIHANVVHVNFTPYLFAPLWVLRPTLDWLYGIIILWNIGSAGLFARLILKKLSPEDADRKTLFAMSVLVGSGFLMILNQMAQFLLFAGPFVFAAYYCLLAGRRGLFFAAIVGLCLVSEDAAMVAVAFAAYIHFFEPERRAYARDCALFSVPYLLLLLLVVQPAARVELGPTAATTTHEVVGYLFKMTPAGIWRNVWSMLPLATLLPAFVMAGLVFGRPTAKDALRGVALSVLPAFPHWGESFVVGGSHHLAPPFYFMFLALLRTLGAAKEKHGVGADVRGRSVLLAATAVFFLVSLRVGAPNLPARVKPFLYRLWGDEAKALLREQSLLHEEETNRAVVRAAEGIPAEKSLAYWVNKRVPGSLIHRTDLWQFPDYFDLADYLLVQKDALDLWYKVDPGSAPGLREAIKKGNVPAERDVPMTAPMLEKVVDALVREERTHRVVQDDEHVLLLERLEHHPFYMPPETIGFGWLRALSKRRARSGDR